MKTNTLIQILLLIALIVGMAFFIWTIQDGSFECKINPISYAEKKLTEKYDEPIYCECSRNPRINSFDLSNFSIQTSDD